MLDESLKAENLCTHSQGKICMRVANVVNSRFSSEALVQEVLLVKVSLLTFTFLYTSM